MEPVVLRRRPCLPDTSPGFPLQVVVSMNCVLFAVWHHLHAPSDGQHLRQCLLLVEAFSFPGQGALAFFIFQCCFLNSVPIWLRTAAERPEDWSCDNTTHLDAAIALLSIMLSQQEDIDVASVRSDQTLGPASLRDWSGDLALRLVQTVGCRFTLLRPVVLGVWRLLRTLRSVSVAGIKWDVLHFTLTRLASWNGRPTASQQAAPHHQRKHPVVMENQSYRNGGRSLSCSLP